jgi:hypothetical protein
MSAEPAVASGGLRAIQGAVAEPVIPRYGVPRKPLGDPAPLACTVAKTAVEAILGGDGLETLVRWVAADVRESLSVQQSLARRAGLKGAVAHIERARVCRVSRRAAEVSIVATANGRARAVAMRFEDIAGRWLATVIEIV